jgi:DNA-binding CsgD family transcriptional regulator
LSHQGIDLGQTFLDRRLGISLQDPLAQCIEAVAHTANSSASTSAATGLPSMDCNVSELFSETTLDALSIAALLVNGKGHIRHMNQRAAAYLNAEDCLLLQDGRLTANKPSEGSRLESLISSAASCGRNGSEVAPGGAIRLSRLRTEEPLYITVIPVPNDNQLADGASSALVFVSDPSASPRPRTSLLRQLYGLTPAEARVAHLLFEGAEVREAAERIGITLETCRFHIKRVLAKTETHRQTELLRLMLSLPRDWSGVH